jgi:hypothetical protein
MFRYAVIGVTPREAAISAMMKVLASYMRCAFAGQLVPQNAG